MIENRQCRFCKSDLKHVFADLESSPPSNDFLRERQLDSGEIYYPLKTYVCETCWLVQLGEYKKAEALFSDDYVYFSSYSQSWLKHSERYVHEVIERYQLDANSFVVELASNDGYLLQYVKKAGIPCLGIEPTASTAKVAIERGIETVSRFFGKDCAIDLLKKYKKPTLMTANNVIAHVPDINDFVGGIKIMLDENGVFTAEFPHLMSLIENNQFDTIYHEHFSYFSLFTMELILKKNGLYIFDVQKLTTHGGSLRIHVDHGKKARTENVEQILKEEIGAGVNNLRLYEGFQNKVDKIKVNLLDFLITAKKANKSIAAYGAAAKGNTILNYCGVKKDLLPFVVDLSPHKQGKFLPGSRIPVVSEAQIKEQKPDYVVILPWNLKDEVSAQLSYIRKWDAKFVIAVPELLVF